MAIAFTRGRGSVVGDFRHGLGREEFEGGRIREAEVGDAAFSAEGAVATIGGEWARGYGGFVCDASSTEHDMSDVVSTFLQWRRRTGRGKSQ